MAKIFGKKAAKTGSQINKNLLVKRCPECFINLPMDARECFSCHTKVGRADKHGKARKRGMWVSYVTCLIAWAIFIGYLKWAFF
ncbi:MAG: hypothetical protein U5L07_04335 [Desulfobacterales bacterium]|nr:hypothetical protein [Desulfobacterales bacterium]